MRKYIIVSGVDGSGKTSIIDGVKKSLESEGKSVSYIWMRQNNHLVTLMHAIAKAIGLAKKEDTPMGKMWLHYFYKSSLFCWFYLRATYIDNWFARKKPLKLKTDFVICDRWVNDIVIDLASAMHQPQLIEGAWYNRFQQLLPADCCQLIVIRSKESVKGCRLENTFNPDFEYRFDLYERLSNRPHILKVNNNGNLSDSIKYVLVNIKRL